MGLLILMRHGESEWNRLNQFTGWVDVSLSKKGIEEAIDGGKAIADIPIDVIFMSTLIRSQLTAMLAMAQHTHGKIPVIIHQGEDRLAEWSVVYSDEAKKNLLPVYTSWHLNERLYGELQGLNKAKTAERYGADQVQIWRRSYDTAPPSGESLKMTAERTIPYFEEAIVPYLEEGKTVFVSAHGNSLRAVIMKLEGLSETEVVSLELPTGKPMLFRFEKGAYTRV